MVSPIIIFLNGFSALALVISASFMLFYYLYQCHKNKTKPIGTVYFLCLAIALGWTGIAITTLSVVIHGYNLPWVAGVISYFSYSTIPIGALAIIYTTWNVAGSPSKKKYVLMGFFIYSLFYYIVLFLNFEKAVVISETGVIYDDWITSASFFYYVLWGECLFAATISGIGFNKFRKATPGELHSRSMALLSATPIIGLSILLDTVIFMEPHVNFLFLPRFAMILGLFLVYKGFKPS